MILNVFNATLKHFVKESHLTSSNLVSEVEMGYQSRDHVSLSLDTSETFDNFSQYLHLGYQLIIFLFANASPNFEGFVYEMHAASNWISIIVQL